jgi:AICAR transformylase/IMP cyclohydrolase PurH
MKALISVSDKTGIVELAQALHALKVAPPNCWPNKVCP